MILTLTHIIKPNSSSLNTQFRSTRKLEHR